MNLVRVVMGLPLLPTVTVFYLVTLVWSPGGWGLPVLRLLPGAGPDCDRRVMNLVRVMMGLPLLPTVMVLRPVTQLIHRTGVKIRGQLHMTDN